MDERRLNVYDLPSLVAERELAGSTVVVIDPLRASTTICHALAAGALEVAPFVEIDDVLAAAGGRRAAVVLGGERAGGKITGFDLGNSPSEYGPAAVAGRRVLLTTTNGTRALRHARLAGRVLVGAIVNLSAVAAAVRNESRVDILCAGTDEAATREDILAAGGVVDRVLALSEQPWHLNDAAQAAHREWLQVAAEAAAAGRALSEQLALTLRDTTGGRNLLGIGLDRDLADCAEVDKFDVVPELDLRGWRIRLAGRETPP